MLKATARNVSCNNSVSLDFKYQLAKVRVVFTGANASKVTNVQIEGYTSCTNNKGEVKDPTDIGEINMKETTLSDGTIC